MAPALRRAQQLLGKALLLTTSTRQGHVGVTSSASINGNESKGQVLLSCLEEETMMMSEAKRPTRFYIILHTILHEFLIWVGVRFPTPQQQKNKEQSHDFFSFLFLSFFYPLLRLLLLLFPGVELHEGRVRRAKSYFARTVPPSSSSGQ